MFLRCVVYSMHPKVAVLRIYVFILFSKDLENCMINLLSLDDMSVSYSYIESSRFFKANCRIHHDFCVITCPVPNVQLLIICR